MKSFTCVSLVTMTAIALLGSQPEYASSQSTDSSLSKAVSSSQQGFSVKNMETSVNPKDDFYHFAVGNWLKKAVIPDDKTKVDSFTEAFDRNSLKIQKIMEDADRKSVV